jgi:hypothetical protein
MPKKSRSTKGRRRNNRRKSTKNVKNMLKKGGMYPVGDGPRGGFDTRTAQNFTGKLYDSTCKNNNLCVTYTDKSTAPHNFVDGVCIRCKCKKA